LKECEGDHYVAAKDERKMLIQYYEKLHESGVAARTRFFLSELEKCLSGKDTRNRVKIASKTLERRNLIAFLNDRGDALWVQLSLEGYDLGRKYSSWWTWTGLLFAEHKNHWIWVTISFFGGILATLLVQWLSKVIVQ
jgi:hypothetical protein